MKKIVIYGKQIVPVRKNPNRVLGIAVAAMGHWYQMVPSAPSAALLTVINDLRKEDNGRVAQVVRAQS